MPKDFKILLGYDGSEYADIALDDLQKAGLPEEADAFVATIAEMWIQAPRSFGGVETSYVDENVTGEAQSRIIAAKGAEKLKEYFPKWTIEHAAAAGSAAGILLAKADAWKPDLIVVGSQSRGPVGRFFFGSVAHSLVNNALSSVRVARRNEGSGINNSEKAVRILVGVDGSEGSDAAVDSIISRNWSTGIEVCVASAMDYLVPLKQFDLVEPTGFHHSEYFREELQKAEKNINEAAKKLERAGFPTISVIKNQDPKTFLIEQAKEWKADCVFVGAKGLSRIKRILIGSVSSSVAARAECSVEVVRSLEPKAD